jgi:hypothetical protein
MLGFRRVLAVLAVASGCVWMGSALVTAAGNPKPTPVPPPPTLQDYFCGDLGLITVAADADSWKATLKTFTSSDGTVRLMFTGHQSTIVSGNGKTLTFDSSGPGVITIQPDGTVTFRGEGHLFYVGPPGTVQAGIFLYSGLTTIDVSDPTNAIVSSYAGNKLDICALLRN